MSYFRFSGLVDLSCMDGSLFASPILGLIRSQMQSCFRPVDAVHLAAGPERFHQPSPIPQFEPQAYRTFEVVSWLLG